MDSNIQRSVRSLALLSVLAGTMALTTGHVATAGQRLGRVVQLPGERDPRSVDLAGQRP